MKTIKFSYITILTVALLLFTGCNDDNGEEEVSDYVGTYSLSSAQLTSDLTLATNEMGNIPVSSGTDITSMVSDALLSSVQCSSSDKSRIELRENGSMFMTCEGEATELDAGTWEEESATVLKLNMNSTAIPTSPTGMVLTISDVS